jgi:hypothetical protein
LLDNALRFCNSMRAEDLCNAILWKVGEKNEPLLDWVTKEPVKDVLGEEMVCFGGWNAPINTEKSRNCKKTSGRVFMRNIGFQEVILH